MAQVRTRKCGKTWSYIFEAGNVNGKRKVVEKGGHIERRSKVLPAPDAPKVSLVCTRDNGQLILHGAFIPPYACGAAPRGVAGRLGHANTQITQDLYSHNTRKLQEEPASIFDNFLQTNFYRLYFKRSYIDSFIAERN